MAINSVSSMLNTKLRMTGMSSGLDTDALVKNMLALDQSKLNKISQKRQLSEWKRDSYREITGLLKTFKDDNFDVLKPTANMRSSTSFAAFSTSYSQLTADTVSIVSGADATIGDHTINVTALAKQAQIATGTITEDVAGSVSLTALPINLTGKTISLTVDGTTKSVPLANYATLDALRVGIQAGVDAAFGNGKVTMSFTGAGSDKLKFATTSGSTLTLAAEDSVFTSLGFSATDSKANRALTTSSLQSVASFFKTPLTIADANSNISFSINGTTVDVGKNYTEATISDIISAVNKSDAGVEMKYSSLTDTITLKNKAFGAANDLVVSDNSDGLLASMGLIGGGTVKTSAADATFDLDGVPGVTRNTNSFTIEGNSYTLKQLGEVKLSISKNTDEMVTRIKGFVTKYNDLLDKINGKYSETYEKAYQPLTDEQKASMDSDTINKWEAKAKTGLLSRDSILSNITTALRGVLADKVDGVGISLSEIGISSSSYMDKGKLKIDETKLKEALNNNYSEVVSLFTKESSTTYVESIGDIAKKTTRVKENGLAQRMYDVLQDNIRTTNGKGTLLIKAGISDDITEYVNLMDDEMDAQDKLYSSMLSKINQKSDKLYSRFAAIESAMNKMNAQSSWLSQQSK